MRFHNRTHAGVALIAPLRRVLGPGDDAIILALARGGVVVAAPVADVVHLPLDVLVVRKLGLPEHPEVAMGAVARGQVLLDYEVIETAGLDRALIDHVIAREMRELERRERVYRRGTPPPHIQNRGVILIDDGLATGSTMISAARAVRLLEPARIVLAIPVASEQALCRLQPMVDAVVCLVTPRPFHAVGESYRDFSPVGDAEVVRLLQQSMQRHRAGQPA
ncbi:MAG: phosphoribosyltransferase family protein [Gemmatimonadota bacterium]